MEVLSGVFYVEHRNDFDFNGIIKAVLDKKLRYEGECFYNEISGVGQLYRRVADKEYVTFYEGEFRDQKFEGIGRKSMLKRKTIYEGQFIAGKEDGFGRVLLNVNGDGEGENMIVANFSKGLMHGVVCTYR